MKLELKHVAPYIAYRLKFRITDHYTVNVDEMNGIFEDLITIKYRGDYYFDEEDNEFLAEPVLRPLSDLTKEIEHNGEKFVPIVELFKIKTQVTGNDIFDYYVNDDTAVLRLKSQCIDNYDFRTFFEVDLEPNNIMFSIATETYKDDVLTEERINLCGNEMKMFQKLFEWHFDVYGLIENNLAVDINTLK